MGASAKLSIELADAGLLQRLALGGGNLLEDEEIAELVNTVAAAAHRLCAGAVAPARADANGLAVGALAPEARPGSGRLGSNDITQWWCEFSGLASAVATGGLRLPDDEKAAAVLHLLHRALANGGLPAGWGVAQDGHGRMYFANVHTGASSWSHPLTPQLHELAEAFLMCFEVAPHVRDLEVAALLATWTEQAQAALHGWVQFADADGQPYFQNQETGEFTLGDPAESAFPYHFKVSALEQLRAEGFQVSTTGISGTVDSWQKAQAQAQAGGRRP